MSRIFIMFVLISFWAFSVMFLLEAGINEPYQAITIPLGVIIVAVLYGVVNDKQTK